MSNHDSVDFAASVLTLTLDGHALALYGAMMASQADMIRERVTQIDRQLADQEAVAKALRQERDELIITLRVMERFGGDEYATAAPAPDLERRRQDVVAAAEERAELEAREFEKRKPAEAPTVPEMIRDILRIRYIMGEPGLEPKDILTQIQERWWPDAPSTSVGPIAWRMWKKEGRLVKDGNLYSLPPNGDRTMPGSDSSTAEWPVNLFDEGGPQPQKAEAAS